MLDRVSGKIVHIDFGDCFEVAMTREKFPEKIPFRLTRMLIQVKFSEIHCFLQTFPLQSRLSDFNMQDNFVYRRISNSTLD